MPDPIFQGQTFTEAQFENMGHVEQLPADVGNSYPAQSRFMRLWWNIVRCWEAVVTLHASATTAAATATDAAEQAESAVAAISGFNLSGTANDKDVIAYDISSGNFVRRTIAWLATSLNLGTLAAQAANNVTITGGSITGMPTPTNASDVVTKDYADNLLALNDALLFKGALNCAANPNYPAADAGHSYRISVAGKIGGASGPAVEAGDLVSCFVDSSAAGNHAAVGANWVITQSNIDGAVVGPASAAIGNIPKFSATTGKSIEDSGIGFSTDVSFAANSDNLIPTQKATKSYADATAAAAKNINIVLTSAATYVMQPADDVIDVDATGGAKTVTPLDASSYAGKTVRVRKNGGDTTFNSVTITGVTTLHTAGEVVTLQALAGVWFVIARYIPSVWTAYNPTVTHSTGGVTNVTHSGFWRRVGDSIEVRTNHSFTGTPAAFTGWYVSIPSGLTFDGSKTSPAGVFGQVYFADASAASAPIGVVLNNTNNTMNYTAQAANSTYVFAAGLSQLVPVTYAINDIIGGTFSAPITGWNG